MQRVHTSGEVRLDIVGWTPDPSPAWLTAILGQVPLFRGLRKDDLRVVAGLIEMRHYVTGVRVVRAGAPGDALHVILDGHAAVQPEAGGGHSLAPGDFFGELALLDGAPRSATVVASEGLTTARLPGPAFRRLLREEPAIAAGLLPGLVTVVRDLQGTELENGGSTPPEDAAAVWDARDLLGWQLALRHTQLFSSLPERRLKRVARRFDVTRWAAGSELVRSGARGDAFFVILDGSVRVDPVKGPPGVLGAGGCFGELALIDGAPRAATITAASDVTAAQLSRAEFGKLLRNEPRVALYLGNSLVKLIRTLQTSAEAAPALA